MSLVVGEIDDSTISLVADTKITYQEDPTRTRRTLRHALPKLVILRTGLAAGHAGRGPERLLTALVAARELEIAATLANAVAIREASFVFASLHPAPQLWQVAGGEIEERSSIGRAWVGDPQAYECFQRRYHEWPDGTPRTFRLMSSMQWLLNFEPVPSVGGYLTRVATTEDGFRYADDPATVGPNRTQVMHVTATTDSLTLQLTVPDGADQTVYSILPVVGSPPTPGALAYLIPEAGIALLFPAHSPWAPHLSQGPVDRRPHRACPQRVRTDTCARSHLAAQRLPRRSTPRRGTHPLAGAARRA